MTDNKQRSFAEIELISLILDGADIITGTAEYKKLLELSRLNFAQRGLKKVDANWYLEGYVCQLSREIKQYGYGSDWWENWHNFEIEKVLRKYEDVLEREDY